ncbi:MAG: hypothetical protein RR806_06385 [Oscillospiraceae bacterium]
MRKAIIENEKVIKILELSEVRGLTFPLGQFMVDCSNDDVIVGDDFTDGKFLRNHKPVGAYISNSQLNEKYIAIENNNADLAEAVIAMQYENEIKNLGGKI